MQITVSSGKKVYRRAGDNSMEGSLDSFHSRTVTLPDDATESQVREERIKVMRELDEMCDLHELVNCFISPETFKNRCQNRNALYEKVRGVVVK